jgi:hypothetical protein
MGKARTRLQVGFRRLALFLGCMASLTWVTFIVLIVLDEGLPRQHRAAMALPQGTDLILYEPETPPPTQVPQSPSGFIPYKPESSSGFIPDGRPPLDWQVIGLGSPMAALIAAVLFAGVWTFTVFVGWVVRGFFERGSSP